MNKVFVIEFIRFLPFRENIFEVYGQTEENFLAPGSSHVAYVCLELFHCTVGTHYILRAAAIYLSVS